MSLTINIKRPVYEVDQFNEINEYTRLKYKCPKIKRVTPKQFWKWLQTVVPILHWLPCYKVKEYIANDILAGCTIAVMNIPQGLAYGLIADTTAISGIYTSFFPLIMYTIFSSSRHVAIGVFAIISLMTNTAIRKFDTIDMEIEEVLAGVTPGPEVPYTKLQVGTALGFTVGVIQISMFCLRLGVVSTVLSRPLISGFTTGAACHTFSAQLTAILGLKIRTRAGAFHIGYLLYDIYRRIKHVNPAAIIISVITILLLTLNNELLQPWVSKKTKVIIPGELTVLILGDLISYFCDLHGKFGVSIVGPVPTGFPAPEMPPVCMFPKLLFNAFALVGVSYGLTMALGLTHARAFSTPIDANQELLALSAANFAGCMFHCIPVCASLARTAVQAKLGGMTQIVTAVNCVLMVFIILWAGPLFKFLPKSLLASVILVSLKKLFWQVKDLKIFWQLSKVDTFVWVATFLSVVIFDVDYGLICGCALNILIITYMNCKPLVVMKGRMAGTEIYVNKNTFQKVEELENIKIFYYAGALNVGSAAIYKAKLIGYVNFDIRKFLVNQQDLKKEEQGKYEMTFKFFILDLIAISAIDTTGTECLVDIIQDYSRVGVQVLLAGLLERTYEMLLNYIKVRKIEVELKIFISIHDAVTFAQSELANPVIRPATVTKED